MGLKNLFGWGSKIEVKAASACGSACGAGDKPAEPKPTAWGSACGAGDMKKAPAPPRGCLRGRTSQGTESAPWFGKCALSQRTNNQEET